MGKYITAGYSVSIHVAEVAAVNTSAEHPRKEPSEPPNFPKAKGADVRERPDLQVTAARNKNRADTKL